MMTLGNYNPSGALYSPADSFFPHFLPPGRGLHIATSSPTREGFAHRHIFSHQVRLANEKSLRVSVKGAGHSYYGHNTAPKSVNINMARFNKVGYFHGCESAPGYEHDFEHPGMSTTTIKYGEDKIDDCPGTGATDEADATFDCRGFTSIQGKKADSKDVDGADGTSVLDKLCKNRSFPGIIKTGPGENWYYTYQTAMENKVWVAAGSSGSVGSCGGFIGGTGIGFLTRTFGFTIDNLQALELVVPTGQHVIVGKHLPDHAAGGGKAPAKVQKQIHGPNTLASHEHDTSLHKYLFLCIILIPQSIQ